MVPGGTGPELGCREDRRPAGERGRVAGGLPVGWERGESSKVSGIGAPGGCVERRRSGGGGASYVAGAGHDSRIGGGSEGGLPGVRQLFGWAVGDLRTVPDAAPRAVLEICGALFDLRVRQPGRYQLSFLIRFRSSPISPSTPAMFAFRFPANLSRNPGASPRGRLGPHTNAMVCAGSFMCSRTSLGVT